MKPSGQSQLIYLLSHGDTIEKIPSPDMDRATLKGDHKQLFYLKVAERSKTVSESRVNKQEMYDYIFSLICDSNKRKLNRAVHLLYYSDWTEKEVLEEYYDKEEHVYLGLDFYHTFLTLSDRIQKTLNSPSEKDWLIYLDVFTLCDFTQQLIRTPEAKNRNNNVVKSFFYTTEYKDATVITPHNTITVILEKLTQFITDYRISGHGAVDLYFNQCVNDFEKCRSYYNSGKGCLEKEVFHDSRILEEVSLLSKTDRSGWKIPILFSKDNEIDIEMLDRMMNDKNSKESVLEHIYNTYLIGLLYLPDTIIDDPYYENKPQYNGYNKQTILNTVLIHDIGESSTGDYPSYHPKYRAKKDDENVFMSQMFFGRTYSSDINLMSYLKIWEAWRDENNEDINFQIAHELDIVQFLYKYYHLKKENLLSNFAEDRCKQMENEKQRIRTEIGKKIYNTIVKENPFIFED